VDLLAMQAQTTSLFELHIAAIDLARVGVEVSVGINMFGEVLFLSKPSVTQIAFESFEAQMYR
jgi:hypothetical protein